jgi:hypothetical protein
VEDGESSKPQEKPKDKPKAQKKKPDKLEAAEKPKKQEKIQDITNLSATEDEKELPVKTLVEDRPKRKIIPKLPKGASPEPSSSSPTPSAKKIQEKPSNGIPKNSEDVKMMEDFEEIIGIPSHATKIQKQPEKIQKQPEKVQVPKPTENPGKPQRSARNQAKVVDQIPDKPDKAAISEIPANNAKVEVKQPEKTPVPAPRSFGRNREKEKVQEKPARKLKNQEAPEVPPKKRRLEVSERFGDAAVIYNILEQSFDYLSFHDLLKAASVCKMWRNIAFGESLWRQIQLKRTKVSDLPIFLNILKQRNIEQFTMDNIRFDHFGTRLPKMNLGLKGLTIENCKNRVVETMLRQNYPTLEKLTLKNVNGELDFSGVGDFGELRHLELSQVTLKPHSFPDQKFPNLTKLSLANLSDDSVYEEISKLSETLVDLTIGKIHSRQMVSTILLGFTNIESLTLENIENYANELLQIVKQMRNLKKLTLSNFNVNMNFDLFLSHCSNVDELIIENHVALKPQIANYLIVSGMLKLNLKSFSWVVNANNQKNGKIQFSRSTILDNLQELVKSFKGQETDLEKMDLAKGIFGIDAGTADELSVDPGIFAKGLEGVLEQTAINIIVA